MLKSKSPGSSYSSEIPFYALLANTYTKAAMLPIVDFFQLGTKKSLTKLKFLYAFAEDIKHGSILWMSLLPRFELEYIKQILELPKGEGLAITFPYGSPSLMIAESCVVVVKDHPDDPDKLLLFLSTEDLRSELKVSIEFAVKDKLNNPNLYKWEQLGIGLLNYFGAMHLTDFLAEMKRRTGVAKGSKEERELTQMLLLNTAFTTRTFELVDGENSQKWISSHFLKEVNDVIDERSSRPELSMNLSGPSDEHLMALGELPIMKPCNAHEKRLFEFIDKNNNGEKKSTEVLYHDLWYYVQHGKKLMEVISYLSDNIGLGSFDRLNEMMKVFNEFYNNTPKWSLCGWSSEEVFTKFEKPKLRPLPSAPFSFSSGNMPSNGPLTGSAKVGRNDPCPCGSGKKYKNCHGR